MIGIYDSGLGGALTLSYFQQVYGHYDYMYVADNLYLPYGDKDPERIKQRVIKNLTMMFDAGAHIVILACNTAASFVIKSWQETYPEKKVLSISVPAVERVVAEKYKHVGILATPKTILSQAYTSLFERLGNNECSLHMVQAPDLVDAIESGIDDTQKRMDALVQYTDKFPSSLDCLILGCTHYPLWKNEIDALMGGVPLIDPSREAMKQFGPYLHHHPEIEELLTRDGTLTMYVSKKDPLFEKHIVAILEREIEFLLWKE